MDYLLSLNFLTQVEILAVLTGLIYISLLVKENIWCWFFGIISSILSIYLFIETKLYSEAILYFYYVLIGVYGWYIWSRPQKEDAELPIQEWGRAAHLKIIGLGLVLATLLGSFFYYKSDANNPYVDAHTTIFGFIASYLEVHKVLSGWIFWIILNFVSIGLYIYRDLELYAGLMLVYFILSIAGYLQWKRKLELGRG